MLARGRLVRQSKLLFYAKLAEKGLQVGGCHDYVTARTLDVYGLRNQPWWQDSLIAGMPPQRHSNTVVNLRRLLLIATKQHSDACPDGPIYIYARSAMRFCITMPCFMPCNI